MDNSFFILNKQQVEISRFHICTWDIENENSLIEVGMEFNFPEKTEDLFFKLVMPSFLKQKPNIKLSLSELTPSVSLSVDTEKPFVSCLLHNLIDNSDNSKFIFNDNISNFSAIQGDKRNGAVLTFETRIPNKLSVIPIQDLSIDDSCRQIVSFNVKNNNSSTTQYIRLLIKTPLPSIAILNKGITQTSSIFDIKLNEKRNLPDEVHKIVQNKYILCKVQSCFCFHVIPNSLRISFVDQTKLKNIRELEVHAFKQYLPNELKTMKEGKYMIVFNKDKDAEAYSFFTIFTKETIGTKQVLFAIGANILCSLLFGFSMLRTSFKNNICILKQIPIEYWFAIGILIVFVISLFCPLQWIKSIFKS
ncbi:MAG: hypothetical protein LBQ31_04145 [Bacteroidales bacterium]|jgi:hypothetical protein|nr:hypothetical protein [Bacteroidales bacterium]